MQMKPITKIYRIPEPVPAPEYTAPPPREPVALPVPKREPVTVGGR